MRTPEPPPALQALLYPFARGLLQQRAGQHVLFLNACLGPGLSRLEPAATLCEQPLYPLARPLELAGFRVGDPGEQRFELVLVLVPRQRDQARALYARALDHLAPGGRLVAAAANVEGARSAEADLARLCGAVSVQTKYKCRVFWTAPLERAADPTLLDAWREVDAPQPILEGRFLSRPGLFAWDRVDPASALLIEHLDPGFRGRAADLGAGWGLLSAELLRCCPGIVSVDLFEADARALELARANLEPLAAGRRLDYHWHDVSHGIPGRYDLVVSNPPFHQGRIDDPSLGRAFITAAAAALVPGGRLMLVANRHLPYEATLRENFTGVETLAERDGFKLFSGTAR